MVYQDSRLISYGEFSFSVLRNTHNIEDFAIQIAISIGSEIRYCNNEFQFIVIGIYFTTPLFIARKCTPSTKIITASGRRVSTAPFYEILHHDVMNRH